MTTNRKGRAGWHQATPKTSSTCNFTGLAARVKGFIVTLTLWGWLPVGLADWFIHWGEPHDECAISQFKEAIRAAGLEPPDVIEPGKLHRFPGVGKRNGNTAGWCKLV